MCRLLGIYGPVKSWREILSDFQELSEKGKIPNIPNVLPGHKDGWGMACSKHDGSGMDLVGKYLGSAREAPEYREKVHNFQSQPHTFLCHLRKASPSIPISLPNCHPFLSAGWAFIHNGTVYKAENLENASRFQMTSDNSDSEFLFHYLLRHILEEESIEHRIERLIESLLKMNLKFSSLNSILSNGSEMYVIRYAAEHHDYFTLFYNETGSGVIVSSELIGVQEVREGIWTEMQNRSVLSISSDSPKAKLTRF
ncbi:hypothetical protein CEE45_12415 [Candidatus Heimdallarchaeota archaeon B3_Heim]|nr:MAG: hypothetical protein CEE45_12415 [Candidatus Heimdallarchaeota archaeon B3_Heim]